MSAKHQTLAVRNKALSVLAGSVRAPELVPAQLDLDDTELDDIGWTTTARSRRTDAKAHMKTVLSLLWTTCPDLTRCVDNLS